MSTVEQYSFKMSCVHGEVLGGCPKCAEVNYWHAKAMREVALTVSADGTIHSIDGAAKAEQPAREGWKLVHTEPTEEMLKAGERAFALGGLAEMYRAMVAAVGEPK